MGGLLRLLTAAGLLAYTFWRSNPREIWHVTTNATVLPLLAAVGLVLLDRALMAWRWLVLLRPIKAETLAPFGTILRIFFVSTFLGTFLPGSIGGDAVRAYRLSRHQVPAGDAVASVFVDRMLGVLSLLLMTPLGLLFAYDLAANTEIMLALMVTTGGCIATAFIIFSDRAELLAARLLQTLPWHRVRRAGEAVVGSMRRYGPHHRSLVLVLMASVAVQVLRVVQAYYLGVALRIDQPIGVYFMFVPLILLVMLLPLTISGVGTSQAAFLWLFGRAGTADAAAFALSILFVALGVVGNLPGAFLYAAESAPQDS